MFSILGLLACGPTAPPAVEASSTSAPHAEEAATPVAEASAPDAPPPEPELAEAEDPEPAAPSLSPADVAGSWTSASCGERGYARNLELREDGSYSGTDLVSPCPPRARCVWSGVIDFGGSFTIEEDRLLLSETRADRGLESATRPEALHWDAATQRPVELIGEQRCPLAPGSTLPFARPTPASR